MGKLFQCSGGSAESRREEATKLVTAICEAGEDRLTKTELRFVEDMGDENVPVSPKQLFWLRDIREKYDA